LRNIIVTVVCVLLMMSVESIGFDNYTSS